MNTHESTPELDALIIGAGLTGMHQLYNLKRLGFNVRAYDRNGGVGGVWYQNRYPGARFDSAVEIYTYSFSKEILEKWNWKERFSPQPDNLEYLNFAADVMGVKDDIEFNKEVKRAVFHEELAYWEVQFADGSVVTTRFLVTATGPLSVPTLPRIDGIDDFKGISFHTANWPHDPNGGPGGQKFDFSDKRVGVIGNGSSGIQVIEAMAREAKELYFFQRTPQWTEPINNHKLTPEQMDELRATYEETFKACLAHPAGYAHVMNPKSILEVDEDEREAFFEELYASPGMRSAVGNFHDAFNTPESQALINDFFARKIRSRVKDQAIAEKLIPDSPFGARRVAMESTFYEAFNQDNVHLIDLRETPIERITEDGVRTTEQDYPLDFIIYATGFDAHAGTLENIDIVGRDGRTIKSKFREAVRTYLGTQTVGFPNLFILLGPHSGSVATNVPRGSEMHVEWLTGMFEHIQKNDILLVEPTEEAEAEYTNLVHEVFAMTPYAHVDSWYSSVNTNVGKFERTAAVFAGGLPRYRQLCEDVAADGYRGFSVRSGAKVPSAN